MNIVLKPSLEHMALVKIVISLWNQVDVRDLIVKHSSSNRYSWKEWKKVEERVIKKVLQLSLPKLLKEKVLGFVKPIGLQIEAWMQFYHHCYDLLLNLPVEFCWTPQGTIDRKRTAEVLVKDKNLDISTRYELACINCLEDYIIQLAISMPEDLKKSVSYKSEIVSFWSHNMSRRGNHIDYRSEFDDCAVWGNKVAVEYFLKKLTPQEREECLVRAAKHAEDPDTLCFLISELHEDQQIKVFRHRPYKVLQSFLKWPFQSFFIETANYMWDFLSRNDYDNILRNIINKVKYGYKDWNYQKLFSEFWQKSPSSLKSFITNEIDRSWILMYLFSTKDKVNIRLIIKDSTLTAKEKLIYSDVMIDICKYSINNNEWEFLVFFIRECFPSKSVMLKFKEEFEKCMMHSYFKEHFEAKKHEWDEMFRLSEDSIFQ